MARTDTFPLVDRIVPGGLAEYLRAAREPVENRTPSYEDVAYKLRTDHDITVSAETVRKWCARTGADSPTDVAEGAA